MTRLLTEDQIATYHRDGFLSPVDIYSEDEAAELRAALEDAERRWPGVMSGAGRNGAHMILKCLDEITHDARILDAVEDLIGPDIMVCGSVLFIKEPNDPGFVSWHQDAKYMGFEPFDGVTAWLALSESNPTSGCMRMLPGTHDEIRTHEDTYGEQNILTRGQAIEGVDETAAVDLVLRPGQLSFHHPNVIHGSRPNRGGDRRIGFVIQSYIQPHCRQTLGPTYAQLARGEDAYGHFERAPRPSGDMVESDVARWTHAGELWSDILYHGAERRRDY